MSNQIKKNSSLNKYLPTNFSNLILFLKLKKKNFTTSCLFLSFLIALFFYEVALANCLFYIQQLPPWRRFEVLNVDWAFMLDILTVTMYVVVTFISLLVYIYSAEYILLTQIHVLMIYFSISIFPLRMFLHCLVLYFFCIFCFIFS